MRTRQNYYSGLTNRPLVVRYKGACRENNKIPQEIKTEKSYPGNAQNKEVRSCYRTPNEVIAY